MTFVEAVIAAYGNYANFGGRARRAEFWWFFLFTVVVQGLSRLIDVGLGAPLFEVFTGLMLILPFLSVSSRRLHDIGRPAGWTVLAFVPVIDLALLIVWAKPGDPEPNRYGEAPDTSPVW